MLARIAIFMFLGRPLFIYFGLLAFLSFSATALIGYLNFKGKGNIPFQWHPRMAVISLVLAIIHIVLAISLS